MLLPDDWSVRKIQSTFDLKSKWIIEEMKDLKKGKQKQSNISATGLSEEHQKLVVDFYEREDNSRQLPGMKDVKTIKTPDGTKIRVQKKLILSNLKELYASFKKEYSEIKVGFTKFSMLRPAHCVLAGSSGTHTVCVCIYHQNVKLMLEGIKILLKSIFSPNNF